jgi:hypothetical protein
VAKLLDGLGPTVPCLGHQDARPVNWAEGVSQCVDGLSVPKTSAASQVRADPKECRQTHRDWVPPCGTLGIGVRVAVILLDWMPNASILETIDGTYAVCCKYTCWQHAPKLSKDASEDC